MSDNISNLNPFSPSFNEFYVRKKVAAQESLPSQAAAAKQMNNYMLGVMSSNSSYPQETKSAMERGVNIYQLNGLSVNKKHFSTLGFDK